MINVLCDEFSLTMSVDLEKVKNDDLYFEKQIDKIDNWLSLSDVLDNKIIDRGINGYETGVYFGYDNKKVGIFYSKLHPEMKIFLRFSAETLKNYIRQYELNFDVKLEVYDILQALNTVSEIRLSRFDIAIDFIDEDVNVNDLFNDMKKDELKVFNKQNREIRVDHYVGKAIEVETLYFNKRESPSYLRVYNKKNEQIQNIGPYFVQAQNCDSWTRFELEIKKSYAHKLTELVLNSIDELMFKEILLNVFVDCFRFKYKISDNVYMNTDFYNDILEMIENKEKLITVSGYSGLDDFEKKYEHMKKNGSLTYFKMFKETYGEEELYRLFDKINNDIDKIELNNSHKAMINNHKNQDPFF